MKKTFILASIALGIAFVSCEKSDSPASSASSAEESANLQTVSLQVSGMS